MLRLNWKQRARKDLLAIVAYFSQDNPDAAEKLADEIEAKAKQLPQHPNLYKPGRLKGTREMVVRPNYIVVYAVEASAISVLRVLHAAQQYP